MKRELVISNEAIKHMINMKLFKVLLCLLINVVFIVATVIISIAQEKEPPAENKDIAPCQMYWKEGEKKHNSFTVDGLEFGTGLSIDNHGNRKLTSDRTKDLSFTKVEQAVILIHVSVSSENVSFKYLVKSVPAGQDSEPVANRQGRILKKGLRTAWYRTKELLPGCYTMTVLAPGDIEIASAVFTVK